MTRSTEKLIHAALRDGCREHCDALIDELRRQHALLQEWEAKAATWLASPEAAQRLDGYRELSQRANRAEAQRDALLEALKGITPPMPTADAPCHVGLVPQEKCAHCGRIARARAAIKQAEGEKT